MLMEAAEVRTCPERNKCILLLLDEMHVREDLVYDKHEGELIGFTNLGLAYDRKTWAYPGRVYHGVW